MEEKLKDKEQKVDDKMTGEEENSVKNRSKFFDFFPKIITVIFAIFFFVFGIVADVYGGKIIEIQLPFILWWLIGAGFCTILYFFLKLVFSRKVLEFYLSKRILK